MKVHRIVSVVLTASLALALCPRLIAADSSVSRRTAITDAYERVKGSVVNIHSERNAHPTSPDDLFPQAAANRVNGMGTGIVIDPRGYIVTNQHVVENVDVIRVTLSDSSTHVARVVTRDPETDLALLKIDVSRPLQVMPLGTSSDVMVGEQVIAIGNAYGYHDTMTVGIVSARNRDVTLNKEMSYKGLIQTCASINPGNSGGPLLNIKGEMIGVNVAIRAGAQGIGFAIPVDTMIRVSADMISGRKRTGVIHGMVCRDVVGDPDLQPIAGRDSDKLIRTVALDRADVGSPAARADLQQGDILLKIGETPVSTTLEVERALLDRLAGDRVSVLVRRKGTEKRVELVLQGAERPTAATADLIWRKLGVRLSPASARLVSAARPELKGGLTIVEVNAEGAAAKAGVQRGDVLVGLHLYESLTLDNVAYVLLHPDAASFSPLRFYVVRNGKVLTATMMVGE